MADQTTDSSEEILYIATTVFNPDGAEIRYKLYQKFKTYISAFPNVILITCEVAFGEAPFRVTTPYACNNIQIRTNDIFWFKENMLNIIFKTLPLHAKVAWLDADIYFTNENWVNDTLKALDEYKFVQLFHTCESLGPRNEVLSSDDSFIYKWLNKTDTPQSRGRSGLAWASHISTLKSIGWLLDWDPVGASDWFHVFALTDQKPYTKTTCKTKNEKYAQLIKQHVRGSVGCIPGTLFHYFHGYPSDRGYGTRGSILINNEYDPENDIGYREDGLIQFTSDKPQLRQDLINYFKSQKTHGLNDIPVLETIS